MAWKRSLVTVVAIMAAIPPGAAACGRSAESGGTVPPGSGLVTVTTAGTRPAVSVTWAVYRDVTSLDPVYAFGYLENTADLLMCGSLLRQTPDGRWCRAWPACRPPSETSSGASPRSRAGTRRCGASGTGRLDVLDTQVGFGDEPVAVELRGGWHQ